MTLDLPEQLDEPGRRRWVDALAAEWTQPGHGTLAGPVIVIRITRGRLVTWAAGHPWSTYTAEQCFDLVEDYCERHAYAAKLFRDIPSTRFGLADPKEWAGLTWDLVLACAPVRFAREGLRLDVLFPASMNELLRRMEKEQPGAWGIIVAMSHFDLPPSTAKGRTLTELIFPGWGPRLEGLAAEGWRRLRAMVWKRVPEPLKERIKAERGLAVVDTACWAAAREFCNSKSVRDLVLAVLRGDLRLFATRAASRIQNYDRSQYGETKLSLDDFTEPQRVTELTVSFDESGLAELTLDGGEDFTLNRIDFERGRDRLAKLAEGEPTLHLGEQILRARLLDDTAWAVLADQYGHSERVLRRWMEAAWDVIRGRRSM